MRKAVTVLAASAVLLAGNFLVPVLRRPQLNMQSALNCFTRASLSGCLTKIGCLCLLRMRALVPKVLRGGRRQRGPRGKQLPRHRV